MLNNILITLGKSISKTSQLLKRGNGSTWPGHIALTGNKNFIKQILAKSKTKVIIVAGTNGKTTTASLIRTGLEKNGYSVLQNDSGANLLNGIASTILLNVNAAGKLKQEYAILEVDEGTLPLILKQITPDYLVLLNLFRDQLDRYGELNSIVTKWLETVETLSERTTLVLNANDPQIAYLGLKRKNTKYFGLETILGTKDHPQHAADSILCLRCNERLTFSEVYFSHIGNWLCEHCLLKRPAIDVSIYPESSLKGTYNKFNLLAATLVLRELKLTEGQIGKSLEDFKPAFGRQETITYKGKTVQIFLTKNPTSFNQSYVTIKDLKAKVLLVVLNDRVPDGHDVSWIWDVDLPEIEKFSHILVAGDRVYDMALRIKYDNYPNVEAYEKLDEAIEAGIKNIKDEETLYILPTYSAMLETRKILTGKKIL